jgi:nitric oxide reductase NorQ protein
MLNSTSAVVTPVSNAPFYRAVGDEVEVFRAAARRGLPVLLKGPTGCGKTRFVEAMAHALGRELVTVAGHEDMTSADLVGRFLLKGGETVWVDGPLTRAVREGAIFYLDEVVEARQDTTVIIHPLTDARRLLPLDRKGELVHAHPDFQLVVSYNPGYQSRAKDLKPSTRQRFAALEFDYPPEAVEIEIVAHEARVTPHLAARLVALARRTRTLRERGLEEGASTRMVIYAATLIRDGVDPRESCAMTMTNALTDDPDLAAALRDLVHASFA